MQFPRKLLCAAFAFGLAYSARGQLMLGSTATASSTNNSESGTNIRRMNYALSVRVAKGFNDRFYLGAEPGFSLSYNAGSPKSKTEIGTLGVFGRYYLKPSARLRFYAEAGGLYGGGKTRTGLNYSYSYGVSLYRLSLRPGFTWEVTPKICLDMSIGSVTYESRQSLLDDGQYKQTASYFYALFGTVNLGFWLKLGNNTPSSTNP